MILGWFSCVASGQPAGVPLTTITNVAQLRALSIEEARQHHPVELTGVVTFYDPRMELFFVQDETGGMYAYAGNWAMPPLKAGQRVSVKGVSSRGLSTSIILEKETTVLGEGPLPSAKRVALEEVMTGQLDAQWVEVEGVIRRAAPGWLHLVMSVVNGNSRIDLRLANYPTNDLARYVGARVRMRGVAATSYDRRKIRGYEMYLPGPEVISVLRPPPADVYAGPLVLSTNLLTYGPPEGFDQPVRLKGIVTMHVPRQWLSLRDGVGAARVYANQTNQLVPGTEVEVAGYVARRTGLAFVEDAKVRMLGTGTVPAPLKVRFGDVPPLELATELVQFDAELVPGGANPARRTLLVKSGPQLLTVQFPTNNAGPLPALDAGSQLRLTGVLQFELADIASVPAATLWLRAQSDLLLVQTHAPGEGDIGVHRWLLVGLLLIGAIVAVVMRERVGGLVASDGRSSEARRRSVRELLLLLLVAAGLFAVATAVDFFEMLVVAAHQYERWQLDEIFLLTLILTWLFGIYSWRRYRDIEREIAIRQQVEAELREGEKRLRELLEDRQRLGQDLHDGIIQSIYVIGLAIEDCRRTMETDPQQARQRLQKSLGDLNAVIREVRNFISGLEPEALKGAEFRTALKSLVLTMNESGMAKFVLQVDPLAADALNSQQTVHLLRVAQEAMSNSLRHGGAKTTVVSLQRHGDGVRFEVHDDGVGFDVKLARAEGHGLRNIAARSQQIGARFELHSEPGSGTRIVLDITDGTPARGEVS